MEQNNRNDIGKIIKQRRIIKGLLLKHLAAMSGVSITHIGRIERGERLPSAKILRRLAEPLGFSESELFTLANFLSPQPSVAESQAEHNLGQLDPYVASVLSQEPVEVQRTVTGMLSILKIIAKAVR